MKHEINKEECKALLVHIEHSQPIDLDNFTNTLHSLGKLYNEYACKNGVYNKEGNPKLYIEKIEKGSIDIFLSEMVGGSLLPFTENANMIFDFALHVKNIVDYFTKGSGKEPELDKEELHDVHQLFNITAKDKESITTIGAINLKGAQFNNCTFNYNGSNSAQNQIKRKEQELIDQEPSINLYERQLLTIYQVRKDCNSKAGNKGVIEDISPNKTVGLLFSSNDLQDEILYSSENPTQKGYYVDVKVHLRDEKIIAYEILKLHDIIDIE